MRVKLTDIEGRTGRKDYAVDKTSLEGVPVNRETRKLRTKEIPAFDVTAEATKIRKRM